MNGQLGAIPRPSGPGQASYLSICGKVLAAPYRSGESLPFKGEFFKLIGLSKLQQLKKKHGAVRHQVDAWVAVVEAAEWKGPQAVKERYRSADFLHDNRVIFNVKGNQYRIVATIDYEEGDVRVDWAGTHAEYSKMRF